MTTPAHVATQLQTFGQALTARRMEAGMTQGQLADRVGLSRASIANMEAGRQNCTITTLALICIALGTTPGALLSGDGPADTREGASLRRTCADLAARNSQLLAVLRRTRDAAAEILRWDIR